MTLIASSSTSSASASSTVVMMGMGESLMVCTSPLYVTSSTILRFHDFPSCTSQTLQLCISNQQPQQECTITHQPQQSQQHAVKMMKEEEKYKIVRKIGQGTFGKVYEAEDRNNRRVAIKRVEKASNVLSREVDILKAINHEYCIKLLDVFYTSEDGSVANPNKFQNFVFEYHPTTLFKFIQDGCCTPPVAKIIFFQLCTALKYIHEKRICHRDVTPSNILLAAKGHVVLADFGSAKRLHEEHISMSYVCSRYYRAPELLLGCSNYSTKVDIWAAGCILAEMLIGRPIFQGIDNQDQFMKIVLILGAPSVSDMTAMKKGYKQELQFPPIDPLYFGSLLPRGLPESEIVADLLYGMLCYNPKSRLAIDAVLKHPYFDDIRRLPAERLYVPVC